MQGRLSLLQELPDRPQGFHFQLRVGNPFAGKSHQFRPAEIERLLQLQAHRAVIVVIQLARKSLASLENQRSKLLHHRRPFKAHVFGRRMEKGGIAAALDAFPVAPASDQALELFRTDFFADVIKEQNLKGARERRTCHRVPIIPASAARFLQSDLQ